MDFEQKRNIGFVYLLENLSPKSGFGKKAVKDIAPYSDIKSLKEEQHNLAVLLKKLKANEKVFKRYRRYFFAFGRSSYRNGAF